ncbi:MAG: hypothetical protein PHC54_06660 [Candidatus Omnitrophica bacterium]|nr:hypothetical protein [Candidatus Omnitrophota bacterium]
MKIKIGRKVIAKSLLSFIGIQALAVVIGLCQKYIFSPAKPPFREETKKISDYQDDVLYGAIRPFRIPIEPVQDEDRVLSISLVGTTSATATTASTGPSGDITILDSSIDFPV